MTATGDAPDPKVTIYVALLDEGVDVWRPVEAVYEGDNRYRITSPDPDPENEQWEFASGTRVCCKPRTFQDGQTGRVAYSCVIEPS
jgi:hypothetical protein